MTRCVCDSLSLFLPFLASRRFTYLQGRRKGSGDQVCNVLFCSLHVCCLLPVSVEQLVYRVVWHYCKLDKWRKECICYILP